MAESKEELKSLLRKVKEENEKVDLKLSIQKMKIIASSSITADGDCSHEIKRHLLLERKAMTNLENIKKQTHYLTNQGPSSQSYGFSSSHVWMWRVGP